MTSPLICAMSTRLIIFHKTFCLQISSFRAKGTELCKHQLPAWPKTFCRLTLAALMYRTASDRLFGPSRHARGAFVSKFTRHPGKKLLPHKGSIGRDSI